uniref:Ubiquitin thioesterase n=1 Tax=Globodera rostochiensis TaxID=31243 RepID=A0A914HD81_GLORO
MIRLIVAEDERKMYERSQQYQQEIEDEVRKTQPLVSSKQEIAHLISEFDEKTSPQYFKKATELGTVYSHIRRIRGDGNCFYRAVLTAQLGRCFEDANELKRFGELVKGWRKRLLALGSFPDLTTGDFCDSMDQLVDSMLNGTMLPQMLLDDLNQDGIANYYVAFCRLICSGYLRENEALYSGFVEGVKSLDQFCRDEIEPMWRECDHVAIIALVNSIGVSIRIEYMDRSQAPSGGWHHDFLVEGDQQPKLFFLYRPGHYDILYRRETSDRQ